ncbi:hypothetical protein EYZ11_012774 [Aspergillus tanneri]|uniref:Uncharacterized protein n=1 Tax=Aspergillus tanneri TaxID=1220188 RepID=A0A4S3IZW8_9EURO|nr:uncharacterized protein ATNIH1004_007239 [Aspergillus tanneri]KAA8645818.1 hypothetical protein ATNIH1004_007239 [Aspergillus tanneri]THC87782.1 hypothetical protein EYZ11_012774 [Aspergillus tanneri]
MAARSRSRVLLALALPPVVAAYGTHRFLTTLETKYPAQPPHSTSSVALGIPANPPTQHCAYVDVYSARVPVRALQDRAKRFGYTDSLSTKEDLSTVWARVLLGTRLFRAQSSIVGLFSNGKFDPGDTGDAPGGFSSDPDTGAPRQLVNGLLLVERPPSNQDSHGLLCSWKMADGPRKFFENISFWGYPWRLMSGGRHEMSVSEPFDGEGEKARGPYVEVRFSSAHDFETFPSEGGVESQKHLPGWVARLHRGYARLLLDIAVRELEGRDNGRKLMR